MLEDSRLFETELIDLVARQEVVSMLCADI